jgi:hypothetical protein
VDFPQGLGSFTKKYGISCDWLLGADQQQIIDEQVRRMLEEWQP